MGDTEEQIEETVAKCDNDGDGYIDFEEFSSLLRTRVSSGNDVS